MTVTAGSSELVDAALGPGPGAASAWTSGASTTGGALTSDAGSACTVRRGSHGVLREHRNGSQKAEGQDDQGQRMGVGRMASRHILFLRVASYFNSQANRSLDQPVAIAGFWSGRPVAANVRTVSMDVGGTAPWRRLPRCGFAGCALISQRRRRWRAPLTHFDLTIRLEAWPGPRPR